jgi:hypothetical protein
MVVQNVLKIMATKVYPATYNTINAILKKQALKLKLK